MDIVKPKAVLFDWEGTITRGYDTYPYITEILEVLKNENIYTAVVSNMRADYLRKEVASRGLRKYFDKIIGFGDCSVGKPSTEPLFKALEGSGIDTSLDVFFIGDGQGDIICALNSGCRMLFINTDNYPENLLQNCRPHHIFKNHLELWNFIDKALK